MKKKLIEESWLCKGSKLRTSWGLCRFNGFWGGKVHVIFDHHPMGSCSDAEISPENVMVIDPETGLESPYSEWAVTERCWSTEK